MEELVTEACRLAKEISGWYARRWPRFADEAESAAMLGAWQAARRWTPEAGVRYRDYARHRIVGAVRDAARGEGVTGFRRGLRRGDAPKVEHAAMDTFAASDEACEYQDTLKELCRPLPPRHKAVMQILYGEAGQNAESAAARMGVTASRIWQIRKEAIQVIRDSRDICQEEVRMKATDVWVPTQEESQLQAAYAAILRSDGPVGTADVGKQAGLSLNRTKSALRELVALGLVRRDDVPVKSRRGGGNFAVRAVYSLASDGRLELRDEPDDADAPEIGRRLAEVQAEKARADQTARPPSPRVGRPALPDPRRLTRGLDLSA